jgi:hypothetical protein
VATANEAAVLAITGNSGANRRQSSDSESPLPREFQVPIRHLGHQIRLLSAAGGGQMAAVAAPRSGGK